MSKSWKKILCISMATLMMAGAGASVANVLPNAQPTASARRVRRHRHRRYLTLYHHKRHAHRSRRAVRHVHRSGVGVWFYHHADKIYHRYDNKSFAFDHGEHMGMNQGDSYMSVKKRYYNNRIFRYGWIIGHATGNSYPTRGDGGTAANYSLAAALYREGVGVARQNPYAHSVWLDNASNAWDYIN